MRGHITAYPVRAYRVYTGDGEFIEIDGCVFVKLPDGTTEKVEYTSKALEEISNIVGKLTIEKKDLLEEFVTMQVAFSEKLASGDLKQSPRAGDPIFYCSIIDEEAERAEEEKTIARKEAMKRGTAIYVRFGAMPKDGRSYNYRDDITEDGVSVFKAVLSEDKTQVWINIHSQHALGTYLTVCDRQLYRVYGNVIGEGSDGEPCIKVTRAIKIKDAEIEVYSAPVDE